MDANGTIDAIIFDLGGVVMDVRMERAPKLWATQAGVPPERVEEVFWSDTEYQRLERGEITIEQYHASMNGRLGGVLPFDVFLRGWNDVFVGLMPEVDQLLHRLDGKVRLLVLSNTSTAHTTHFRERFADILPVFERQFLSQEIGARKPDAACYQAVIDYAALPPHRMVFVDDKQANVDAARALGLHAIVALGTTSIAEGLSRLGVLPAPPGK